MPLTGGASYDPLITFTGELASILKEYYLPGIHSQLENATILLKYLKRNTEEISGRYAIIPIIVGRNWGVGYRTDRAQMPQAGSQRGTRAQVPMASVFGTLQVTLAAQEASRNTVGAYQSAIEYESRVAAEDLPKMINERLFGNGTGVLALVDVAGAGANDVTCTDNSIGGVTLSNDYDNKDRVRYLHEGMPVAILSPAGAVRANSGAMVISAINRTTGVVTFTGARDVAVVQGDLIVLSSFDGSANEYNAVTSGLGNVVSDVGTFQGINRALEPRWKSNVIATPGGVLTLDTLQNAMDTTQFVGGGMVQLILTSPEVRRKYLRLLVADKRFTNTLKLDGGFTALEYDEIPLVADPDCPTSLAYFLDLTTLALYEYGEMSLFNLDGLTFRKVPNFAAVDALYYWYHILGARNVIRQTVLTGIDPTK